MSDKSAIEWTEATWNPVRGCTKVSAGCKNCYAETFAERWRGIPGHPYEQGFDVRLVPEALELPLRWKKPRRVFVNSMSDLFHEDVPFRFIATVFGIMQSTPRHTYQVLTKRAARMREFVEWFRRDWLGGGKESDAFPREYQHVWLGVSVENQTAADERIPHLLDTPAAVRFLSCEPLLGPVNLTRIDAFRPPAWPASLSGEPATYLDALTGVGLRPSWTGVSIETEIASRIGWVIIGGESGPGARPCDVAWIRRIVKQCRAAGVSVFVKQLGAVWARAAGNPGYADPKGSEPDRWPEDLRVREFPKETP